MPDSRPDPTEIDRLRWQCRRGMLELDEILLRYLEDRFPSASADDQARFRELLASEDPLLNQWLLLGIDPRDQALVDIVRRVRAG